MVSAAPAGRVVASQMCSLAPEDLNCWGRRPLTVTLETASAALRSSENVRNAARVTAVMLAVPERRLIATLYSRSSS
jgi:hypothetical protein